MALVVFYDFGFGPESIGRKIRTQIGDERTRVGGAVQIVEGRHFKKSQPLHFLSRDDGIQLPDVSHRVLQFWFWSGFDRTKISAANWRKWTRDGGATSESGALSPLYRPTVHSDRLEVKSCSIEL
jgi:hypothetical protein